MRGRSRRVIHAMPVVGASGVLVLAIIITITLSLAALVLLDQMSFDWASLSEIGESFGGVSAVLAAVALIALSWSTVLQVRQLRIGMMQSAREMQFKLMTMAMDDCAYSALFLPSGASPAELRDFRTGVYMTLHFRYLEYEYLAGGINDEQLRLSLAVEYFAFPAFRARWTQIEPVWREYIEFGRRARFYQIVVDEYAKAEAKCGESGSPP